jgi:hypothetical protein
VILLKIELPRTCAFQHEATEYHENISDCISKDEPVTISFGNVQTLTSNYLNGLIGPLYSKYTSDIIQKYIIIEDIQPHQKYTLKRVIENSKRFFKKNNMEKNNGN